MLIIGCDYHPSVQQIAWGDTETGECGERRLTHSGGEAEQFYRGLKEKGISVRVGMEATGHSRWFERLLAELNYELWVGDPAQIRAKRVRKQKNDRRDAEHLLKLMLENNFPRNLGANSGESGCTATGVAPSSPGGNADASDESVTSDRHERRHTAQARAVDREGTGATGVIALASLDHSASARTARTGGPLRPSIDQLSQAIEQEAARVPEVQRLQTHPGVGPITALAFVLVLGTPARFGCGKQVASYLGLIPCEDCSADSWRLGHISKQGNALLRFLLGQAAQSVARSEEQWRHQYAHLALRRNHAIAKVAMARKLAVRLFWMWRRGWDYQQLKKFGSHVG